MLILGMGLAIGAYLLTHLNLNGTLPSNWMWGVGLYAGIGLAGHLLGASRGGHAVSRR